MRIAILSLLRIRKGKDRFMESDKISFLNDIRKPENKLPAEKQVMSSVGITVFGIILGIVAKYLDCTPANELPYLIRSLDFTNFLGRFSIWIFIAVCISIYSKSAVRAAVNVFVFFTGMVSSYYLYSKFIAGFFPKTYVMIWVCFTIISPFLAFVCWYAKGNGKVAIAVSAGIISTLFNTTFIYGLVYFSIRYTLELVVFLLTVFVLRRTLKETAIMVIAGVIIAIIIDFISPIHLW